MIIFINDKPCEAKIGDLLLKVAQHHKSHIGCVCGGNAICQSCFVYVKEGAECMLTRAEYVRRLVLGLNVPGFITYAQTIGYNVVNKLPDGAGNLFKRVKDGKVSPGDSLGKIGNGLAYGSLLASHTFMETFPFMQYPVSVITESAKGVLNSAGNVVCNVSGGRLHIPGTTDCGCGTNKTPVIESVKISVK